MAGKPDLDDEVFYEQVVAEQRRGERHDGLWAKALAESPDDPDLAQSLYVKWRAAQLQQAAREKKHSHPTQRAAQSYQPNRPWLLVVLALLTMWFVYDGWFNPEMEWIKFNRVGAVILGFLTALAAVWYRRRS